MKTRVTKVTAIAVVAVMIAAALATAAPATATDTYTPSLAPAASAGTVAVESVATFRPAAAAKRATISRTTTHESKPAAATAARKTTVRRARRTSELAQAKAILAGLKAKHPLLKGTSVEFGNARGYQAVAYYRSGRIVISKGHTASLKRILNHEVWHIIDYRDNGRIDWGENVPPR